MGLFLIMTLGLIAIGYTEVALGRGHDPVSLVSIQFWLQQHYVSFGPYGLILPSMRPSFSTTVTSSPM